MAPAPTIGNFWDIRPPETMSEAAGALLFPLKTSNRINLQYAFQISRWQALVIVCSYRWSMTINLPSPNNSVKSVVKGNSVATVIRTRG
jgi:hypothetical protein